MVYPTLKRRRWSLVLKVFSPRHSAAARWNERESPVGGCKYGLPRGCCHELNRFSVPVLCSGCSDANLAARDCEMTDIWRLGGAYC